MKWLFDLYIYLSCLILGSSLESSANTFIIGLYYELHNIMDANFIQCLVNIVGPQKYWL